MAEKMQDVEDRLLEAMFRSEAIADDGFSARVLGRIRRQIWVRRLALPIAMLIGAAVAIEPLLQLISIGSTLLGSLQIESVVAPATLASQLPLVIVVGTGTAIAMLLLRMLEE